VVAEDEPTAHCGVHVSACQYALKKTCSSCKQGRAKRESTGEEPYLENLCALCPLSDEDMACAIVGSPEMKLEHAFRRMVALKIADKLSLEDCRRIAYVSAGMDDQVALPYRPNFRLYVLTTLESRGLITPTKLDFLEDNLRELQRNDLLKVIEDYKKTREYKKAIKRNKKLRETQSEENGTAAILRHPSDKDHYEELYAEFLTQFSKLSVSMRAALESNDSLRMKLAFSNAAAGTRKLSHTVRKTVSEIDSYSSRESSGKWNFCRPHYLLVCAY
jgi:hypothetical protein